MSYDSGSVVFLRLDTTLLFQSHTDSFREASKHFAFEVRPRRDVHLRSQPKILAGVVCAAEQFQVW